MECGDHMTWMPFVCLAAGLLISLLKLSPAFLKLVDWIINFALIVLMITIGMNIGTDDSVIASLATIGLNCVAISLSAIALSVAFIVLAEKTVLPLSEMRKRLYGQELGTALPDDGKRKLSPLLWMMPVSIVVGIIAGYWLVPSGKAGFLEYTLLFSLILLYVGVGISMGTNRGVFKYVKLLGLRVLFVPLAVLLGSFLGGLLSGLALGLPPRIAAFAASGVSYYSLTGAYMTRAYGAAAGTYGFVVNVMREFFTVVLMPLLARLSLGSPIASGAAGCMDSMLVPVTRAVGAELGLVALISGVVLTFAVPFLLPLLHAVL